MVLLGLPHPHEHAVHPLHPMCQCHRGCCCQPNPHCCCSHMQFNQQGAAARVWNHGASGRGWATEPHGHHQHRGAHGWHRVNGVVAAGPVPPSSTNRQWQATAAHQLQSPAIGERYRFLASEMQFLRYQERWRGNNINWHFLMWCSLIRDPSSCVSEAMEGN